jgi:3,4-dihydroxy 2-butanone 4-phosphate synthase/GTP cyclohydrolase II
MEENQQTVHDLKVSRYSQSEIPLESGMFTITVYHDNQSHDETLAIHMGLERPTRFPAFARIHSECLTGEVLGSLKCDCRDQLHMALRAIAATGKGVVIYLRQEGRGIGLGNKIKAYDLQNKGLDTIEANHELGFPSDLRDFSLAGLILRDLGVDRVNLNTNNPDKVSCLKDQGITVENILPSHAPVHAYNREYLDTKRDLLGHSLVGSPRPKTSSSTATGQY